MTGNMNVTIRRLTNVFILFFLIVSGIAAYVQVGNQAFFNGPALAHGQYDTSEARNCPPFNAPVRGTIYDRNGVPLAWSVPDNNAYCGYRRVYDTRVYQDGLAPLIGYFSYQYGTGGIEHTLNNVLAGVQQGQTATNVYNKLLHKPEYGNDIYLTIDINLQAKVAAYYNDSAVYGIAGFCPGRTSTTTPGSVIVEDPNNGEILAMYSWPSFDPNQIDNPTYWQQINSDPNAPLLNRATQGLYVPGSIFKTVTLIAALDTGQASLATALNKQQAVYFTVPQGTSFNWVDYINGQWANVHQILDSGGTISLKDAYAYSDNTAYAHLAYTLGANTWLSYVRKFGIATPGTPVDPVPFDGPYAQSSAYPAVSGGQQNSFSADELAASGFGQGELQITPLTMSEVTSTVAADGLLYEPHVVLGQEAHTTSANVAGMSVAAPQLYSGGPIIRPETASAVRQAMWAVTTYGTASTVGGNPNPIAGNTTLANSPVKEGGKTGTGQTNQPNPRTWWISLAPDDAAPGGSAAKLAVTVAKEGAGDGACQVYVADDTYLYAQLNHIGPYATKP